MKNVTIKNGLAMGFDWVMAQMKYTNGYMLTVNLYT